MPVDHHAEEHETHDLAGRTSSEVLRAAADLIEAKEREAWGLTVVNVSVSSGFASARIVFERPLAV
jgi:hypothetical protein